MNIAMFSWMLHMSANVRGYKQMLIRGGIFLLVLASVPCMAQSGYECVTPDAPEPEMMGGGSGCSAEVAYTPDQSNSYQNTPNLVFKINHHFVRPTNGSGPYAGDMSILVAQELGGLNWFYDDIDEPIMPVDPPAEYINDSRVRFVSTGIYYHDDDTRFNYYLTSPIYPNCSSNLRDEFGVDEETVINIFYYQSTFNTGSYGCGPSSIMTVNMVNCMPSGLPALLAHELGHVIGLSHTFGCGGTTCLDDGISDTYYPDCNYRANGCGPTLEWFNTGSACPNLTGIGISNNIMGYNSCRKYLSPMQLALVHRRNITMDDKRKYIRCEPHVFNPVIIVANSAIWESSKVINANIEVEPGVVLDVRCTLYMSPHAKIIVKQGAKLIVDGGTLTSHSGGCNSFWPGIEVWGDNAHNQFPSAQPTYQGMVVLKNGATIEHARETFNVQAPEWGTFGGVVQATDATFINCRRSAQFLAYQNSTPGGTPIGNRSFFKRCHFYVDDNYRGLDDFATHVSMWKVDGITFSACTFENLQTTITESGRLGMGITSIDASYRVLGLCTTNPPWAGDVCPSYTPTTFRGLDHGIDARNFITTRSFIVDHSLFEDNICGVYANGVVGFQVKNSKFKVGGNAITDLTNMEEDYWFGRHRAVFSTESWAFAIDNNELEQNGSHEQTEGIVVGYSRDHNDVVFHNTATGLERAYIGEGICADLASGYTSTRGLWFLCNQNSNNSTNFWGRKVTSADPSSWNDHTIRLNQGAPNRPADNVFDQWPNGSANFDFLVTTSHSPIVYWHRNTGNYLPTSYTQSLTGLFPAPATYIPANNCASKLLVTIPWDPDYPNGMAPGPVVNHLLSKKLAYGNTRYLYEQLIDDGNTDEVVQEIQESWPQDAWALRDYLLSKSPFLSLSTLMEMVLRDIMPDAMVTEILVANPEATRQDGFLRWLQNESGHPLPDYMLGMVVASWDQRTYRDALEGEMTAHHAEMTQAANMLLHHYQTLPLAEDDSTSVPMDSILWVWQQVRTPAARYAEALTWLQLGNHTQATHVVEALPTEHDLKAPEALERQRMLDLIAFLQNLHGIGRSEMQLESGEVATLQALMGEAYDRPATWISNLLCFGYQLCRPPLTGGEEDGERRPMPYTSLPAKGAIAQAVLRIHPNPASTWVALEYDMLVEPTNAALVIRDLTGREVYRTSLPDQQQEVVWDTRQTTPGSYTVVLLNAGRQLCTEKLIIRP